MHTARLTDGRSFPIGKIVCVGRNYAEHIRELGNESPTQPVIFMKPASAVIGDGEQIRIPLYSDDCHHEVELALLMGRRASSISADQALSGIAGYGVAIDLTLRDVQSRLKEKGLPWEISKGFDTSCPLSSFVPASQISDPHDLRLILEVNGQQRQDGSSSQMITRIPELLAYISSIFTLEEGDVILTGTPAGVSAIKSGDTVQATIEGVATLTVTVA
ncbi:MAG TPA: fumarylacetoacetate hydrolase family protein [Geobacterales bacterium]|nr:fumarylacetoacetate hydrolase family protein [Geobacterales bacterium]